MLDNLSFGALYSGLLCDLLIKEAHVAQELLAFLAEEINFFVVMVLASEATLFGVVDGRLEDAVGL